MNAKTVLCAWLILAMLAGMTGYAESSAGNAEELVFYSHEGRLTLVDGACTEDAINGFNDASAVVEGLLNRLGGDARTRLAPWRDITDAFGNRYYVFQQMCGDTTVLGGAVKVIVDPQGRMVGLTSSIEDAPAESESVDSVTAEQAERIVLDYALSTRQQALSVVEGPTQRMILPLTLKVDVEADDEEGSRYVWVVYTDNPNSSLARASDLPYLAHYVTLAGEYLYSLPTIMPGDEAGATGFDAGYVFEFMEPATYTGYVDLSTGGVMELTVNVMRDKRTGMYYLGDLDRRIVVADCWEFLYDDNRVVLAASADNREWDQVALLTMYNYCRAYDYYREIGWVGGDGLGTPILILNDYCDVNHLPVDNAAYVGGYLGWQIFLSSRGNDFSQCLDVLAHEFTHCVTGSVMTYNAYRNDYGAINEAMSDIQGKTCQMLMEGRESTSWKLGDSGLKPIRSMDDPHRYAQPEFTWDAFYVPNVKTPTVLNDEGGVHTNSSILNRLAYQLYERGGMTLQEGRAFWFTVDCAMVPGTNYAQLAELLPLALRLCGLERYDAALREALDATRLGVEAIPETFDEDRALLTLELPEKGIYADEQWILMLYSVNVDKLISAVREVALHVLLEDYSVLPKFIQAAIVQDDGAEDGDDPIMTMLAALLTQAQAPGALDRAKEELSQWLRQRLSGVYFNGNTNAGLDGRTMRMVCVPGNALPILMHGIFNESTSTLEDAGYLIYVKGRWLDLGSMETVLDADMGEAVTALLDEVKNSLENGGGIDALLDLFLYRIDGGQVNALPADALADLSPSLSSIAMAEEDVTASEPRMSRPKEEEISDAA